jgi:hypothetical protein
MIVWEQAVTWEEQEYPSFDWAAYLIENIA